MAGPIVTFDHVWKKFRRGERHDSLRDLIPGLVRGLLRPARPDSLTPEEFWAVQDVSFEVKPGRALGIIGPNGAGKSTILKLLTRILRPNRGSCVVRGRVGALIEIAAGFHMDLTGRENIFLQGAVMGMKRSEVIRKIDQIVEFAGVGEFIDTPVKRYSSGMNARLGFSIAAHLDPDVLIIDEVLSVGDMAFQEKCVERMRGFKRRGVAIVFVSHNLQAVTDLCEEALYLRRTPQAMGPSIEVVDRYVRDSFAPSPESVPSEVGIAGAVLRGRNGSNPGSSVSPGAELRLSVDYVIQTSLSDVTFALVVHRATDQLVVYNGHFFDKELGVRLLAGSTVRLNFDLTANLTRGQYYFEVFVYHNPSQRFLARLRPAAHLTVNESRTWAGVAYLDVSARPELTASRDPDTFTQPTS